MGTEATYRLLKQRADEMTRLVRQQFLDSERISAALASPRPEPPAPESLPAPKRGAPPSLAVAALDMAATLSETWTVEQLAVECWRLDPVRFGLRGYESLYPDVRTVANVLAGPRGLVARKKVVRLGGGLYRLA